MKISEEEYRRIGVLIERGLVRSSQHPRYPELSIFSYTPRAEYEEVWDEEPMSRKCRGLVLNTETLEVMIPCVEKFFNIDTKFAPKLKLDECEITEKEDGYLIQCAKIPGYDEVIVTSRGSFDSQYAEFARRWISERGCEFESNKAYICELLHDFPGDEGLIVTKHPESRILVWAIKERETGEELRIEEQANLPFEAVRRFTPDEARKYLRKEVEGVVAHDWKTGQRVKIKTEWFFKMHRIISDCTEKRVLETLTEGKRVEELDIPDEFMKQMLAWQKGLLEQYQGFLETAEGYFESLSGMSDKELGQASEEVIPKEYATMVFMLRKDRQKQLRKFIWRCVRNERKGGEGVSGRREG